RVQQLRQGPLAAGLFGGRDGFELAFHEGDGYKSEIRISFSLSRPSAAVRDEMMGAYTENAHDESARPVGPGAPVHRTTHRARERAPGAEPTRGPVDRPPAHGPGPSHVVLEAA